MADKWLNIIEMYKKAEKYLWGNAFQPQYHVDREKARIYLYSAYYRALKEEEKNHLWYARILLMMYEENHGRYNEYSLFHCFLREAFNEYMIAAASENDKPKRAETDRMMLMYKRSKQYAEMCQSRKIPRSIFSEIIGGLPFPSDFDLRECMIVSFRHDTDNATLKLSRRDITVTLGFGGIYELTAGLIPAAAMVSDILLYRCKDCGAVVFDIGYYKIICAEIEVTEIKTSRESA